MNKTIRLAFMTLFGLSTMACQGQSKKLVLYYSQTGTTKAVAEEIQRVLGTDIEAIDLEDPYTGSFMETVQRASQEQQNNILPTLKPLKSKIADYDVIFLGFPIWSGTYAPPITALLKSEDFAGKKVVPFCTFGSGGIDESTEHLKKALPKATVLEGYGVRAARVSAIPIEVNTFLMKSGFVKGDYKPLPDFSEQKPVTDQETSIFNAACDDYQMPLGSPISFGVRKISNGTEYKFKVNNNSVIYVVVGNAPGSKPEFTKVVR